jgi:hypothetical protein
MKSPVKFLSGVFVTGVFLYRRVFAIARRNRMKHCSLHAVTKTSDHRRRSVLRRGFQRWCRIKPTIRYFQITASSLQLHHHPKAG